MATNVIKPNVGASGRRRIVPMMGIDFIAGQIERKGDPAAVREKAYGTKPASMGGRTRRWSFINFLNVDANFPRSSEVSQDELLIREQFSNAVKSANATIRNLSVLTQVEMDYKNGTRYFDINPWNYATFRGWVMAVRFAQKAAATDNTWPPTQG